MGVAKQVREGITHIGVSVGGMVRMVGAGFGVVAV
jgi:hypothetical protein